MGSAKKEVRKLHKKLELGINDSDTQQVYQTVRNGNKRKTKKSMFMSRTKSTRRLNKSAKKVDRGNPIRTKRDYEKNDMKADGNLQKGSLLEKILKIQKDVEKMIKESENCNSQMKKILGVKNLIFSEEENESKSNHKTNSKKKKSDSKRESTSHLKHFDFMGNEDLMKNISEIAAKNKTPNKTNPISKFKLPEPQKSPAPSKIDLNLELEKFEKFKANLDFGANGMPESAAEPKDHDVTLTDLLDKIKPHSGYQASQPYSHNPLNDSKSKYQPFELNLQLQNFGFADLENLELEKKNLQVSKIDTNQEFMQKENSICEFQALEKKITGRVFGELRVDENDLIEVESPQILQTQRNSSRNYGNGQQFQNIEEEVESTKNDLMAILRKHNLQ